MGSTGPRDARRSLRNEPAVHEELDRPCAGPVKSTASLLSSVLISVADAERDGNDVRGDAVGRQVDGVDAPVAVRVGDDRRCVVVDPILVLVSGNRDAQDGADVLAEARAPTIQVSQISFVVWFVNPVRLKRLARFWALRAPTVLVERSTIRPGSFSSMPAEKAPGKGAWFWWVVGPVSWKSAPLDARLGYWTARSTKKPLLALPAVSPGRGAKTCTLAAGSALADVCLPVAAVDRSRQPPRRRRRRRSRAAFGWVTFRLPLVLCPVQGWWQQDRPAHARPPHGAPVRYSVRET